MGKIFNEMSEFIIRIFNSPSPGCCFFVFAALFFTSVVILSYAVNFDSSKQNTVKYFLGFVVILLFALIYQLIQQSPPKLVHYSFGFSLSILLIRSLIPEPVFGNLAGIFEYAKKWFPGGEPVKGPPGDEIEKCVKNLIEKRENRKMEEDD